MKIIYEANHPSWASDPLSIIREKWSEVPAGNDRFATHRLLELSDSELLGYWTRLRDGAISDDHFAVRGWYHTLYRDIFRGKRVLDVGSGLGLDGLSFAQAGARMTFLDIAETNLAVLKRLSRSLGVTADFFYLDNFSSLDRLEEYDVIWCQGSMINVPFGVARREASMLLQHLPVGGRWIELAYPPERWEREGKLPYHQWGERTDGDGTPWVEWYDQNKLLARLSSAKFEIVLSLNFHNDDFNWFDLKRKA